MCAAEVVSSLCKQARQRKSELNELLRQKGRFEVSSKENSLWVSIKVLKKHTENIIQL